MAQSFGISPNFKTQSFGTSPNFNLEEFDASQFGESKNPLLGKTPPRKQGLGERAIRRTEKFLRPLGEFSEQGFAEALPRATFGLIGEEKLRKFTGIEETDSLAGKLGGGFGTVLGIGAQIAPVSKAAGLVTKGAALLPGASKIAQLGTKVPRIVRTVAALSSKGAVEGGIGGFVQPGTLDERIKTAKFGAKFGAVASPVIAGIGASSKGIYGFLKKSATGIDDGLASVINPTSRLSSAEQAKFIKASMKQPERAIQLDKFLKAASDNADNPRVSGAQGVAEDVIKKASNTFDDVVKAAGEKVGAIKKAVGSQQVDDAGSILRDFNDDIANKFNIRITDKGQIAALPGGEVTLKNATDRKALLSVYKTIKKLSKEGSTIRNLDDMKTIISERIKFGKSPLDKSILEKTIGKLRASIKNKQNITSNILKTTNERFSTLKNAQQSLFKESGSKDAFINKKSSSVLKAILSDKGDSFKNLLRTIAKETGEDIEQAAFFSKFATEAVGSDRAQSRFVQEVLEATRGGGFGIARGVGRQASRLAFKPEKIARNIAREGLQKPGIQAPNFFKPSTNFSGISQSLSKGAPEFLRGGSVQSGGKL